MAEGAMYAQRFSPKDPSLDDLPPLPPSPHPLEPVSPTPGHDTLPLTPIRQSHESHDTTHSPGPQPVEGLAQRLSKQSLRQSSKALPPLQGQNQGVISCSSELSRPPSRTEGPSHVPGAIDVGEDNGRPTPIQWRTSMRSLKRPIAEISREDYSNNLPRHQRRWQIASGGGPQYPTSLRQNASFPSAPADTTIFLDAQVLEADEDVDAGPDPADFEGAFTLEEGDGERAPKRYKFNYRTSYQAAMRCHTLVRNRPRMRKRNKKGREEARSRATTVSSTDIHEHRDDVAEVRA